MSAIEIQLNPRVLKWARERGGYSETALAHKLKLKTEKIHDWERTGKISDTYLKKLANQTFTPFGMLFLSNPPAKEIDLPDFRKITSRERVHSPELVDTVNLMQRRVDIAREVLSELEASDIKFVGSLSKKLSIEKNANILLEYLGLDQLWTTRAKDTEDAIRTIRDHIEKAGILIFFNGVVGNNTHRSLNIEEFRGFAISDTKIPLIFINNNDSKSAQLFTIVHELAHIGLNESGITSETFDANSKSVEYFCNQVAAETLIPRSIFKRHWNPDFDYKKNVTQIAKFFRISKAVVARRAYDSKFLDYEQYNEFLNFKESLARDNAGGGNFFNNQKVRIGDYFARLVKIALEKHIILYRDAFEVTQLKPKTFDKYMQGVSIKA